MALKCIVSAFNTFLKEELMRNIKSRCRTYTKALTKSKKRFVAYNEVQFKYADMLEKDSSVVEIKANVRLKDFELGDYSTDFVVTNSDGTTTVIETVLKKNLLRKSTIQGLDASYKYWCSKGVVDFKVVIGERL